MGKSVTFVEITPNPRPKRCPKWWDVFGVDEDRDVYVACKLLGDDAFLCSLVDGRGHATYKGRAYLSLDWAIAEYGDPKRKDLFRRLKAKVLKAYDDATAAEGETAADS